MYFFQSWQKNQIVHQVLPPLLISSLGIKSCATAAIGDFRLTTHPDTLSIRDERYDWFHLMGNLTPSWVSFHFCIHHDKLIVASISSKVSQFGQEAASTYQELLLILVVISSNSPSVVFKRFPACTMCGERLGVLKEQHTTN